MQGTLVDERYALIELLGGGGMAKVYLAHDEVLDRDVALKVLRDQYADDEKFIERFRLEARNAAALSHPNIVSVYDQGRTSEDGAYYMAMEYVSRGTLKDRIRREGALSPRVATGVALQITDALSEAHRKGVVHRDIKPQNVLVTRTGDVKVADFGIARAASSPTATATGVILGTAGYMSPEQAKGEHVGQGSDLYSLGVVLYEMLTGNLPYEADSVVALALKHITEPPYSPREANPEVPEALDAITMQLLAKDPRDRYPNAEALAKDLERARSGLPLTGVRKTRTTVPRSLDNPEERTRRMAVRPPVVTPTRTSERGARRRSRLFSALATLFVAVAVLGGVTWALQDSSVPGLGGVEEQDSAQQDTTVHSSVQVPDLVNASTAETDLAAVGLKLGQVYEIPSDTVPAGSIVKTDPAGGTEVKEGTTVDIYVSTGPQKITTQEQSVPSSTPVGDVGSGSSSSGASGEVTSYPTPPQKTFWTSTAPPAQPSTTAPAQSYAEPQSYTDDSGGQDQTTTQVSGSEEPNSPAYAANRVVSASPGAQESQNTGVQVSQNTNNIPKPQDANAPRPRNNR